jgi:hypothetical protein
MLIVHFSTLRLCLDGVRTKQMQIIFTLFNPTATTDDTFCPEAAAPSALKFFGE